ncbi:MAG TPA: hypothetical protein VF614_04095, partial [Chthoniobacteraceae bacterium]
MNTLLKFFRGFAESAAFVCALLASTTAFSETALIPPGSLWKYLDNGSDQGTTWRSSAFVDTTWKSGPAQLGYGDGGEATVVSFGSSSTAKYITTYFRRTFSVADAAAFTSLKLRLLRDDGAVVYLNGVEIRRDNLPTGSINYRTLAPVAIGGADETTFFETTVPTSALVTGSNVLA